MRGRPSSHPERKPMAHKREPKVRLAELEAYVSGFAKRVSDRIDILESRIKLLEEDADAKGDR